MIVTTHHVFTIPYFSRRAGFCRSGCRQWFAAHGLDWADFKINGIDSKKLEAIGDAFAIATVKWARECQAKEDRHG